MLIPNYYLVIILSQYYMQDRLREAEMHRLAKMCKRENPNWLTRSIYRLIVCLGRLFVKWGEKLQSYSLVTEESKA